MLSSPELKPYSDCKIILSDVIDRLTEHDYEIIIFQKIRTQPGRPPKLHSDYLLRTLAVHFAASGGRVALGGGPFERFLCAVYQCHRARDAIAESEVSWIKRAKRKGAPLREAAHLPNSGP